MARMLAGPQVACLNKQIPDCSDYHLQCPLKGREECVQQARILALSGGSNPERKPKLGSLWGLSCKWWTVDALERTTIFEQEIT